MSAAGLAAGLGGCAAGGADPPAAGPAASPPAEVATPPVTSAQVAPRVGSVVPERPRGLVLPDGDRVRIRAVGTAANGVLDVPSDIDEAGWWTGSARLGDPFGSTLVAAHVDSTAQGLGPFAALLSVRPGDRVEVWSRGLRQEFAVTSLRLRPRGLIGPHSRLHSPAGPRRITLVTCAGPYDRAAGGYQNLAVVVAEPVSTPEERP